MWCDNCLLVFPLRVGAIAWAVLLATYNIAGALFLFMRGQFLFFHYPEWQIYGGVGMAVAAAAVISMLALSNRSYIWIRAATFIWPFVIVIAAIRAIIMIVELQRGQDNILWECNNGGVAWSSAPANTTVTSTETIPGGFCSLGFSSLNTAFILALLLDLAIQIYMFFLTWRFSKRLEHYSNMKGPFHGGYYNA